MDTADFDYALPADLIAQQPLEPRDAARLLVDMGPRAAPADMTARDLPDLLEPGDVLVVNKSRVLAARLSLHKSTGGAAEVLLLERRGRVEWEALVRPGRRLARGTALHDDRELLRVTIGDDLGDGLRLVTLEPTTAPMPGDPSDVVALVEQVGRVPLPPYLTGTLEDPERYQTVVSRGEPPLSSAAPTAGLHLTDELLGRLAVRGVDVVTVELAVGLGTFRPMSVDKVDDHRMHAERYRVTPETWATITDAQRVIAVGTTVVRTLESVAATGELEGSTELFVHGDFPFRVVDRLMTNFHLPRTSLLVMIEAFVGPRWRDLYELAIARRYRFLSFGDAMLLSRRDLWTTDA